MRETRIGLVGLAGLVLVVVGSLLLIELVAGPVLRPLFAAVNAIGWPLVLIGIGVILLNRRDNTASASSTSAPVTGRFYRSRTDRVVGGVIGGFAHRMGVNATALRLVYAVVTLFSGVWTGVVLYLLAMIIIPEASVAATTAPSSTSAPIPPAPPVPPAGTHTAS